MNITDIRVRKVVKDGKLKAVASITIDDVFVVHGIKIIEGEKGAFIAMPYKKTVHGEIKDICHPLNLETRLNMQEKILNAYKMIVNEEQ